jgi:hypothetical protein
MIAAIVIAMPFCLIIGALIDLYKQIKEQDYTK